MSDMLSASNTVGVRRLKVSTATRQDGQVARGELFVGASGRVGVLVDNIHDSVLTAGPDKYLVIEDAITYANYSNVEAGSYNIDINGYVDKSTGNDWTYNPNFAFPAGRPLNADKINDVSTATIDPGVQNSNLTGREDYAFFSSNTYRETQGQRENLTGVESTFFKHERIIILAPGQRLMTRMTTTGTATGGADIETMFFISEVAAIDAPSILGV
jgi:hypothetical protein